MGKDINTDQKSSSDRPFRPLTPLEKEGVMIAEFMGLRYETRNYFGGDGFVDENGFDTYSHNSIMIGTYYGGKETSMLVDKMQYHESWDWLMPVISKCMEVRGSYYIESIYHSLHVQDLSFAHESVVNFIKEHNNGKD